MNDKDVRGRRRREVRVGELHLSPVCLLPFYTCRLSEHKGTIVKYLYLVSAFPRPRFLFTPPGGPTVSF